MLLGSSLGNSVFELILVLVIFVGVLFLTYYSTRWIAHYQKGRMVNRNLEVVEVLRITNNKYVQILRAGDHRYLVIGVGKDEITPLGELTEDELNLGEAGSSVSNSDAFLSILNNFRNKDTNVDEEEDR